MIIATFLAYHVLVYLATFVVCLLFNTNTADPHYSLLACHSTYYIFSNKGSGEPLQMHRLARSITGHIHNIWMQMKIQTKF